MTTIAFINQVVILRKCKIVLQNIWKQGEYDKIKLRVLDQWFNINQNKHFKFYLKIKITKFHLLKKKNNN